MANNADAEMFEGLGLGTRLAFLKLPERLNWVPVVGALMYSFVTPLGMAIGLGARTSVSMTAGGASISSGVLDSISSGILLYTACVELMVSCLILQSLLLTSGVSESSYIHRPMNLFSTATTSSVLGNESFSLSPVSRLVQALWPC